jgi:hypothetical protein
MNIWYSDKVQQYACIHKKNTCKIATSNDHDVIHAHWNTRELKLSITAVVSFRHTSGTSYMPWNHETTVVVHQFLWWLSIYGFLSLTTMLVICCRIWGRCQRHQHGLQAHSTLTKGAATRRDHDKWQHLRWDLSSRNSRQRTRPTSDARTLTQKHADPVCPSDRGFTDRYSTPALRFGKNNIYNT